MLLRDALIKSGQCAVVKVALRSREALALIRPKDGVLADAHHALAGRAARRIVRRAAGRT